MFSYHDRLVLFVFVFATDRQFIDKISIIVTVLLYLGMVCSSSSFVGLGKAVLTSWLWPVLDTVIWTSAQQNLQYDVRPVKTQICLGTRPVWSESSLSAGRKLGSIVTHWAHKEDSGQIGGCQCGSESSLGAHPFLLVCHEWFIYFFSSGLEKWWYCRSSPVQLPCSARFPAIYTDVIQDCVIVMKGWPSDIDKMAGVTR